MTAIYKPRPAHNLHPVCNQCGDMSIEYRELYSWDIELGEWSVFDIDIVCPACESTEIKWKRNKPTPTEENTP